VNELRPTLRLYPRVFSVGPEESLRSDITLKFQAGIIYIMIGKLIFKSQITFFY
jgi:hypothetical protein